MTLGPWLPLPERQTRYWRYEARRPLSGTMEGSHSVAIPRTRTGGRVGSIGWMCGPHGHGPEIGDAGKDAADRCAAEAGWDLCGDPDAAILARADLRYLAHVPAAPVRDDEEG